MIDMQRLRSRSGRRWGTWVDLRYGAATLVLLSDNNFNARQVTQLLLLAWRRRVDHGLRPES